MFPSPMALARSWNPALIRAVGTRLSADLAGKGVTHMFLPGAKAAVGAVSDSLSEDPLLSADVASAMLAGVAASGLCATVDGYETGHTVPVHRRWSEEVPNERVLREHLQDPFRTMLHEDGCVGLVVESGVTVPPELLSSEHGERRTIRRHTEGAETVLAIARGDMCLDGSPAALQDALHNYRRLENAIAHGKATTADLEIAVSAGNAISETVVDEALDRLLSWAKGCSTLSETQSDSAPVVDSLADAALRGATVLLENHDGILPLTRPRQIALIGDVARRDGDPATLVDLISTAGHTCVGYAPGYALEQDRNDKLLFDAVQLAERSDMAIVFLSAERVRPSMGNALPANQMALVDQLLQGNAKVVLVMSGDVPPDMRVITRTRRRPCGVLLAPLHVTGGAAHVLKTVLGLQDPEGRLAHTATERDDPAGDRSGLKVGPFLGYRYYDTIETGAVYPFGHGLSYTKFRYSNLTISDNNVTFTVENVGKRAGVAVPQVYVGIRQSAVLRPRRELAGYTRLTLAPGAKTIVTLSLRHLGIWDEATARSVVEAGVYTAYVGNSVSDISLQKNIHLGQHTPAPDGLLTSDYLPTISNILTEQYTLEAEFTPMKPTVRNPIFGIGALVLACFVEFYNFVFGGNVLPLHLVALVMAVGGIVFLVFEMRDRNRLLAAERQRLEEASQAEFAEAEQIPVPSADKLFHNADAETGAQLKKAAPVVEKSGYDHFVDVDKSLTFAVAAHDFATLAAEKGLRISEDTARSIMAAMATSRLVVVRNMPNETFASLLGVLSEYLSCPLCMEAVDETYTNEGAVLFHTTAAMNARLESRVKVAMTSAQSRERNLHIAALTNVSWQQLSAYFVPFARYARAPFSSCRVTVTTDNGQVTPYRIPENLWFFLNLLPGETLVGIPDYVADIATIHTWVVEPTAPTVGGHTQFRQFYYGQMLYLTDRMKDASVVDEDMWKKLDRLEAFAARYAPFGVGNKMSLGLEIYLAVLASSGEEVAVALDKALAVKMLPAIISTLSGKIGRDECGLGETLDSIFGEDHTIYCRKTLKESGAELM